MAKRIPITQGDLFDRQVGAGDVLGIANSANFLVGDTGRDILDHAVGGNDTFTGGAQRLNALESMSAARQPGKHDLSPNGRFAPLGGLSHRPCRFCRTFLQHARN
jgi:hypothetical protein